MYDLNPSSSFSSSFILQMDAFLFLAELGGGEALSDTTCLLCVTPAVAEASILHRARTYQQLLWRALMARAMLLRLLHKQESPDTLTHCKQLSALLATSALPATDQLRELQMEVCPRVFSEFLCDISSLTGLPAWRGPAAWQQ